MGRPPGMIRTERVEVRLSQEELKTLEYCAEALHETKTQVISRGIKLVEEKIKENGVDNNDAGTGIEQVR